MKQFMISCAVLFLASLALAGCGTSSTQGPTAWLDEPLDGQALPLAPMEIMAHASDADGVASIEFLIDDVPLARAPTDGGILTEATVGWDPKEPGTHTVQARATDSQGNVGSEATAVVTVGEVEGSPTPLPIAQPTQEIVTQETPTSPFPTATLRPPTPTPPFATATLGPPTATPQPPARRPEIAYFEADPSTINAGECSTLSWGVDYAAEVYLDGEGVTTPDSRQVCPPSTTTYTLFARSAGGEDTRSVTVTVIQPPTPTPIVDTTPPVIRPVWADPDSIDCHETTTVKAVITDPSGVGGAQVDWGWEPNVMQEVLPMSHAGGDQYEAVIGPFDAGGTVYIMVAGWDNWGWAAQADLITVMVVCID